MEGQGGREGGGAGHAGEAEGNGAHVESGFTQPRDCKLIGSSADLTSDALMCESRSSHLGVSSAVAVLLYKK
jgi:hypothetical protein